MVPQCATKSPSKNPGTTSFAGSQHEVEAILHEGNSHAKFMNSVDRVSFIDLHGILDETNKKKFQSSDAKVPSHIIDQDYEEITHANELEEKIDVKFLEKCHLEMAKKKCKTKKIV